MFYVPLPDGEQGHVRDAFGHCTQTETAFNQLSFVNNNKEKSKNLFLFPPKLSSFELATVRCLSNVIPVKLILSRQPCLCFIWGKYRTLKNNSL